MSEYYFFYDRPSSVNCPLARNRLGNEELGEAVKDRAAEFLAVDLLENGEINEDNFKRSIATAAVAYIRRRWVTLISLFLGTDQA